MCRDVYDKYIERATLSPEPRPYRHTHHTSFKFKSQWGPLSAHPFPRTQERAGQERLAEVKADTSQNKHQFQNKANFGSGRLQNPRNSRRRGESASPLRGGRRGAHPALLSCRRGWCPPGDKGVAAIPGCEAPSIQPGQGLRVPVGSPVAPPRPLSPHKWSLENRRGTEWEDLPGAAFRRAAATPETARLRGPQLRWPRQGGLWRPQGARTRGPRLQSRCSARRSRNSTAAHPHSARVAARSHSPRPLPPPWGLERALAEHRPRMGRLRLPHSLRRLSLGLDRRRHRPHAPQLRRGCFLQARAGPAPGLECCASAPRHMETGAARTNRSLGSHPGPAPAARPAPPHPRFAR